MKQTLTIAAVVLALFGGGVFYISQTSSSLPDLGVSPANAQEAAADVDTSGVVEMFQGEANAPLTVIEYSSFTCPHCADFAEDQAVKIKRDFADTGKVKFISRDVYFDRYGLWASMIARCDPQRYFGVKELIYAQQREWIGSGQDPVQIANNLRKIGKTAGLSDERLDQCLNDQESAEALVAWFQKNMEEHDISGTPSLVIGGELVENQSYEKLKAIIEEKLAAQ